MGYLARAAQNIAETRWHPAKWPSELAKDPDTKHWLGGNISYTGKIIDEESALAASAVWSAVLQLSQAVASLPLHLYKRQDRGKVRASNHPVYRLLHISPNPEMTSMAFREQQMGQVLRFGTCYAEKEIDGNGRIIGLWPLLSKDVYPTRMLDQLVYVLTLPSGKQKTLDGSRILRVPGFSPNGLTGYNAVKIGQEPIALTLAVEEYGARFFGNGALPGGVLEHPEQLSQEAQDRLRENWNKIHEGLERSHRIAILEEGMKLHEFESNPQKAQSLETRKFQVEEVARIFNMPVHMLKNLDRATNNNIEFQGHEFVTYTLMAWLVRLEQNYTLQLLSEKEQKKYFFEHLVDGLLRGDTKTRHAAYAVGRQWGYYSANDVREMENKNSIGPQGDIYLIPLNMIPADQAEEANKLQQDKKKEPEPAEDEEKSIEMRTSKVFISRERLFKAYRPLFVDAAQKIVNREGLSIKKALKKRTINEFRIWLEDFYENLGDFVKEKISPVVRSYVEQMSFQASAEIGLEEVKENERFLTEYLETYVKRHIGRSLGQINALVKTDNPAEAITKRVDEWEKKRPNKIANEETVRLGNAIASTVFFDNGYEIVWRTPKGSCEYCQSMNGKKLRKGEYFLEKGDEINSEKHGILKIQGNMQHPPLHRGCNCIVSIV